MAGNFSYLLPGKLAGSARPGRLGDLESDLACLSRRKIKAIVSLTEEPLDPVRLEKSGFQSLHLPIRDFTAPSMEQMETFVDFVDQQLADGNPVLVHCGAGIGRTGVMLAAYLVAQGMEPDKAIRAVRGSRPGSIETPEQEKSLFLFSARRKKGIKKVERQFYGKGLSCLTQQNFRIWKKTSISPLSP